MNFSVQGISRQEVTRTLQKSLGASAEEPEVELALIAAHLRSACYSAPQYGQSALAHSARLVGQVNRNAGAYLSGAFKPIDVLNCLATIGDIFSVGNGLWLPTPPRVVSAPNGNVALLLGNWTAPLTHECRGVGRYITRARVRADHVTQSLDEWLGVDEPLEAWTSSLLSACEKRLVRAELDVGDLEVFAPDLLRKSGQVGWWMSAAAGQDFGRGLRLCRPSLSRARVYDRPYFLAHMTVFEGTVVLKRAVQIAHQHTRRLRYGLEALMGVNRTVAAKWLDDTFTVEVPMDLPDRELRVISLGWAKEDALHHRFRLIEFPRPALPFVNAAFERLSAKLIFRGAI